MGLNVDPGSAYYWRKLNGKTVLFTRSHRPVLELPGDASLESRAMAELDYFVPKLGDEQRETLKRLQKAAPYGVPMAAWAGILPMLGLGFEKVAKYVGINGAAIQPR